MVKEILPEVLRLVFTTIREEQGLHALSNCSNVCRDWREVAQPVLWSHVVLNNTTLGLFDDAYYEEPEKLSSVRTVTLEIQVITQAISQYQGQEVEELHKLNGYPRTQALLQEIDRFSALLLPKMTSLVSLSLMVSYPPDHGTPLSSTGFRLLPEVLGRLLRSLPKSCKNLELDTSGTDWSPENNPHHLCSDIWTILPRLRHIKLRLHTLCSRLLVHNPIDPDDCLEQPNVDELHDSDAANLVHSDELLTMSICIMKRINSGPVFAECDAVQASLNAGADKPWPMGGGYWETKPLSLTSSLVTAYKRRCFPNATKIQVVQSEMSYQSDNPPSRGSEQSRIRAQLYGYAILIRDCIRDLTYPLPLVQHLGEVGDTFNGLYDKSDTCVIWKDKSELERHAENTVWDQTIYGARMPFRTSEALVGARVKPPPAFLSRADFRKRSPRGMLSWRQEEEDGTFSFKRVVPLKGVNMKFHYKMMPLIGGTPAYGT